LRIGRKVRRLAAVEDQCWNIPADSGVRVLTADCGDVDLDTCPHHLFGLVPGLVWGVEIQADHEDKPYCGHNRHAASSSVSGVCLALLREASVAHKVPTTKMPKSATFCDTRRWSFNIYGNGSTMMNISVMMFGIALPRKNL